VVRALRIRHHWTQAGLAEGSGLSRSVVGRIERGEINRIAWADLLAVADPLGIRLEIDARWQGARVDALLDQRHAATVEASVDLLRRHGWATEVEVTFSEFGERGSIDVVGRHEPTGLILVIEVKGSIGDVNQTLIGVDRKVRLMPAIARRHSWRCSGVASLLVITDGSTNRDRVARHFATFGSAFPVRRRGMHAWLRDPGVPPPRGLLFIQLRNARSAGVDRERVRTRR
jgi:transcriptional regulator with XRE-family HTH domain